MSVAESPPNLPALDTLAPELYCPTCDQVYDPSYQRCPQDNTALVKLAAVKDTLLGRELDGRFTLKRRIGAGGMGAVYSAWQHSVGREVAVKVIHPKHNTDRDAAKRFLREAKLASRLAHPNTVTVLDFNQTDDGFLYLVMELLHGRQLSEVLAEDGRFSVERLVRVGTQLCDSLEAAHKLNIVHRDLKPGNIVILDGPAGRDFVKVLDFGLARSLSNDDSSKLTRTGEVVGTPHYLPPEAALGNPMDARGDIYSLGVIFYELLAGTLPFEADGRRGMMIKHVYEEPLPLPLDVPENASQLIMRMLEKDPDRRPSTVGELRDGLTAILPSSGQIKLPSSVRPIASAAPPVSSVPPTVIRGTTVPRVMEERPKAEPTTQLSPVVPPKGPPRWLVPAIGIVLGLGLGVLYLVRSQTTTAPEVTSKPVKNPPPIEQPQPLPPPPTEPKPPIVTQLDNKVELTLRSKPNANVIIDGKDQGRTPFTLKWQKSDKPVEITFHESGRRDVTRSVTPNAAQVVDATLPATGKSNNKPPTKPHGSNTKPNPDREEFLLPNN